MLKFLRLGEVGPAAKLEIFLRPRLNIHTSGNGLGKSFLLDMVWWAIKGHGKECPHPSRQGFVGFFEHVGIDK